MTQLEDKAAVWIHRLLQLPALATSIGILSQLQRAPLTRVSVNILTWSAKI